METYERECCIRGYRVYKDMWEAAIGEELEYVCECCLSVLSGSIEGRHNCSPLTEDVSTHLLIVLEVV